MHLPADSTAAPMLVEIENAALRAADLTRQMLAYSGRGKFVVQSVNLAAIVDEMAKLLGTVVSKKAMLRLDLRPATVDGDATQLRQIVMNLITNASDALGDAAGTIALRTGTRHADAATLRSEYTADAPPEGEYAFVAVEDTGCGMDTETVKRIFDPFFTTKFTGRGLGLAAVLGIIRGHRGTVRVESRPGAGTTFEVLLPISTGKTASAKARPSPAAWRGHGTILLVDDEERVRGFADRVLTDAGFQVVLANDGEQACATFSSHTADFAAVVLDWTMPHMNGADAARRIRESSRVPILFMSGFSEMDVAAKAADLDGVAFLPKPFQPSDLIDSIRRLIVKT